MKLKLIICIGISTTLFTSFGQSDTMVVTPPNSGHIENPIDGIYEFPDKPAVFMGGSVKFQEYVSENVQYPSESIKLKESGRVLVMYIVEKSGKVTNVRIEQSSKHPLLDQEAIRLVENSPKWQAARHKGKKVRSRCIYLINFTL